ncbi:MAG: hypothetical protein DI630_11180 [Gordonia sp. (in: high G+C Gram-positive bacteria)]|nr:MAG: hypothetical protein DI630_11180 [Gordonia sp. (in: high G+C Gram-positive bacteria)]
MTSDSYATSVSGPGALITAIPALLGFIPERSLVLITLDGDGGEIGTTMRHDLVLDDKGRPTSEMLALIEHLAHVCESYEAQLVMGVVIDGAHPADSPHYRRLFAIIDRHLAAVGGLYGGFVTPAITSGSHWTTMWDNRSDAQQGSGPATGVVGDPTISPVAIARAVKNGRRVLMTRDEMVNSLSALPHCADPACDAHAVAADDDRAYWRIHDERAESALFGTGEDDELEPQDCGRVDDTAHWVNRVPQSLDQTTVAPSTLRQWAESAAPQRIALPTLVDGLRRLQERLDLERALDVLEDGRELTCADLRFFDKALREFYVRDSLLALAVTDRWMDAERAWTQAARRLRGRGQASAATLLGFIYYVHGNGAMAGTAFDVALRACPDYSMAVLYSDALVRGIPPNRISECAESGFIVARSLGVTLPDPVMRSAA